MREKIGRNLVVLNGVVKCRIKRRGKFHEWVAPYQGEHAYSCGKDGVKKAKPALVKWLKECERAIAEDRWQAIRSTHIRGGTPTIQEIFDAYRKEAEARQATTGSPSTRTITQCCGSLKRIVEASGLSVNDRVDKLTPEVIERWMIGRTSLQPKGEARDHAVYVCASILSQARCLFAKWLVVKYTKNGMSIPECVMQWPRYDAVWVPKYKDPPEDLKRRTIDAGEELRREMPHAWVLYWLIINFGCRPGDALRLTWGNFKMKPGAGGERMYLEYAPHKTKASRGNTVNIPVPAAVWQRLVEARPRGEEPDDSLIVQPDGQRKGRAGTLAALNAWMRGIGWSRENYKKGAYELRKLFTSAVRNTYGVQLASDWCGSSVKMVQQYYAATYIERMPEIDAGAVIRGPGTNP